MNDRKAMLAGVVVGAGLSYLLDPERGTRRQALMRDKAGRAWHELDDAAIVTAHDVANRTQGLLAKTRNRLMDQQVDDPVLVERVRAKLGRVVRHPHAIQATAEGGVVTLRGDILAHEVDQLIAAVLAIPGTRGVDSQLTEHAEAGDHPSLQGGSPLPDGAIWSPTRRLLVGLAGGMLLGYGAKRAGLPGAIAGMTGAGLLARSITNLETERLLGYGGGRRAVDIVKAINVNAPVEQVYRFWESVENFPLFMEHVQEVRDHGAGRSHWIVTGPAGTTVHWDAAVTKRVPNQEIRWRSEEGSPLPNAGIVRFDPNPDGSTRVQVRMSYNPPAGALGHGVAWLLGSDPRHQMDADLVRFKSLIEEGRTTVEGVTVTRAMAETQMRDA